MDNKLNNMINDFFKDSNPKDEKELNEKLQEFISKYNAGVIDYENTPLDDAYELLEKAEQAKSKKQAIKYAKEAYDTCPDCFDAIIFQANLEDDPIKRMKILDDGLEYEKERLEEENYFEKDNIGDFYGIFENRPYIRGMYFKAMYLLEDGKVKKALDVCKEILRLNEHDNTGARYLLMAIYAYLEDEKNLVNLFKQYNEESLETLFPLFVLYYKQENDGKAKEYLNKINKANPNFIKLFKGTMTQTDNAPSGYYSKGNSSEVLMYFQNYSFLIDSVPNISDYILKYSKKKIKILII